MHLHTNYAIPIIDSAESESSYGMTKSITVFMLHQSFMF